MIYTPSFNYQEMQSPARVRLTVSFGLNKETLHEILKGKYDHLYLLYGDYSDLSKFDIENLSVKWLQISQCESQNLGWVARLTELEKFSSTVKLKSDFDFSNFHNLKSFASPYGKAVEKITRMPLPLVSFGTSSFSGNFAEFAPSIKRGLKSMNVTINKHSNITGLDGFQNLEELTLSDSSWLEDISSLVRLMNLKVPSKNLKLLALGESTKIEDGDVESLLEFPKLDKVSFSKRKNYKYSAVEINEMLSGR